MIVMIASIAVFCGLAMHMSRYEGPTPFQPAHPYSIGLTSPVRLLAFDTKRTRDPACLRTAVIDAIVHQARARGCDTDNISLGGTPTLLITCSIAGPAGSCASDYVAQIWQERWSNSTESYDLYLYARVRAVCAKDAEFRTYHASDEVIDQAERRSIELNTLLEKCSALTYTSTISP